jgi:predicted ArsR family transcriptional regulator
MAKMGRPDCRDKVLAALPGIRSQVAKRAGVAVSSAGKWLDILHKEGLLYISQWRTQKGNGARLPLYKLKVTGKEVDRPRPPALGEETYQQRYNERHPHRRTEIRKAYEERQRQAALKRKKAIAAWAAPLTTVVSKSW